MARCSRRNESVSAIKACNHLCNLIMFFRSLASMRVDPGLHLKDLDYSSNALLNKRKKAKGPEAAGGGSTKF